MLRRFLALCTSVFFFLLPWQTIWLYREPRVNGFKWEFGTLGFYATEILLWGVIFLFMVWYVQEWQAKVKSQKLKIPENKIFLLSCFLFILYCFASLLWSPDRDLALQQALRIVEAFLLFFVVLFGPLRWQEIITWFVVGATLQSLLGIYQFIFQSTFSFQWLGLVSHPAWEGGTAVVAGETIGRWLRAYGAFSHPNIFGGYVVVSLLFTSWLWQTKETRWKWYLRASMVVQIMALFFTFSRAAWIGGIGVVIITKLHRSLAKFPADKPDEQITRFPWPVWSVIVTMAVLLITFFPLVVTRFSQGSMYEVRSVTERVGGYKQALDFWQKHPFRGVGVGNYTATIRVLEPTQPGWALQPVHNIGLLLLTELGVIGVVLILAVFVSGGGYFLLKGNKRFFFFSLLPTIPLFLFDHYLFSSYTGLMLSLLYFAVVLGRFAQIFPTSFTAKPEKI